MTTRPFVIVVGIDYSDLAQQALRVARGLAKTYGSASVIAVAAIPGTTEPARVTDDELERRGTERLQQFLAAEHAVDTATVRFEAHAEVGPPEAVLKKIAEDRSADLLVLGTHGRRGLERLVFGSVAEGLVRSAPCSVLVVRERKLAPEELIAPACADCVAEQAKQNDVHALCATHHDRHLRRSSAPIGEGSFGIGALGYHTPGI